MFFSAKIAGSKVTLSFCAESKKPNTSNVMAYTNMNITVNLYGAAKQIRRPTLQDWRLRRANLYSHSIKYSNCQDKHQADSNMCPFWKH